MTTKKPTQKELLATNLPKWPQMRVSGQQVTVDQAKEIIFRTDGFLTDSSEYSGGNNREFNAAYRKAAGLLKYQSEDPVSFRKSWEFMDILRKRLGVIHTSYVSNDWASCAFIHGAHGWCSPSGELSYVDNVGKWPSVAEVLDDWKVLAKAFPFLDLTATLMSGESCDDSTALVNIVVKNGKASLKPGSLEAHAAPLVERDIADAIRRMAAGSRHELGLPEDWYTEFAARVKAVADTITDQDVSAE